MDLRISAGKERAMTPTRLTEVAEGKRYDGREAL